MLGDETIPLLAVVALNLEANLKSRANQSHLLLRLLTVARARDQPCGPGQQTGVRQYSARTGRMLVAQVAGLRQQIVQSRIGQVDLLQCCKRFSVNLGDLAYGQWEWVDLIQPT